MKTDSTIARVGLEPHVYDLRKLPETIEIDGLEFKRSMAFIPEYVEYKTHDRYFGFGIDGLERRAQTIEFTPHGGSYFSHVYSNLYFGRASLKDILREATKAMSDYMKLQSPYEKQKYQTYLAEHVNARVGLEDQFVKDLGKLPKTFEVDGVQFSRIRKAYREFVVYDSPDEKFELQINRQSHMNDRAHVDYFAVTQIIGEVHGDRPLDQMTTNEVMNLLKKAAREAMDKYEQRHQVQSNVHGIRRLIGDGYGASKHDQLVRMYDEVRPYWFELLKRARISRRQKETKQAGGQLRKPIGKVFSTDLESQFDRIAATYKLPGIKTGRELVEFLKKHPPSQNAANVEEGVQKQIERRDLGFQFEAALTRKMRSSGQYVWVGRSAGSYGAVDIVAVSKRGVLFAQCKATEAERTMRSEYDKLSKLHDELGHLAEIRLYFLRDKKPVYVKIDDRSLPTLIGEGTRPWNVAVAAATEIKRSGSEYRRMLEQLAARLHWRGPITRLDAMYQELVPFWKKLAKTSFQWDAKLRLEFRKILDGYRGFLVSQDAHVTKALMLPQYAPIEIEQDEAHVERDAVIEQRIFKQAGFAMRVEKEPGYRTPIHVLRATTNGSKLIAYYCVRSGLISEDDVDWLAKTVEHLPKQVEFRIAWYQNKKTIKTKTVRSEDDLRWFTTQRGI